MDPTDVTIDIRLDTALNDLAAAVGELREVLWKDHSLRERIEDHERRISAIEQDRK